MGKKRKKKKQLAAVTKAKRLWGWILEQDGPFTAHEASSSLGFSYDTVNHYIRYWAKKSALRVDSCEADGQKLGRPENRWVRVVENYVPIWLS